MTYGSHESIAAARRAMQEADKKVVETLRRERAEQPHKPGCAGCQIVGLLAERDALQKRLDKATRAVAHEEANGFGVYVAKIREALR